jgi:hypothetical protein
MGQGLASRLPGGVRRMGCLFANVLPLVDLSGSGPPFLALRCTDYGFARTGGRLSPDQGLSELLA